MTVMEEIDFFVVGAQKCATTSLHQRFAKHPKILLPEAKELHFFSDTEIYNRGVQWYEAQFIGNRLKGEKHTRVVGEIDPDYLFDKLAPLRMYEHTPNAKIVIVLREPLERAYSHYQMSCQRGIETDEFGDALLLEQQRKEKDWENYRRHFSYIGRGGYSRQIARYTNRFDESSILIVNFDELTSDAHFENTLETIYQHIGVESSVSDTQMTHAFPASTYRIRWVNKLIFDKSANRYFRQVTKMLVPAFMRALIYRSVVRFNRRSLDSHMAANIYGMNIPEVVKNELFSEYEKIEEITGWDLQGWRARWL